jgi:hypothetical protein
MIQNIDRPSIGAVELTAWLTSPSARSSLTDRARLPRSGFDLPFQIGVGILQSSSHLVELIGEALKLIGPASCTAPTRGGNGLIGVARHQRLRPPLSL